MFKRKPTPVPLKRVLDVSNSLTLSVINLNISFTPYGLSDSFSGELTYFQHPEASYNNRGTKHKVKLTANNWPELRSQIDELLAEEPIANKREELVFEHDES